MATPTARIYVTQDEFEALCAATGLVAEMASDFPEQWNSERHNLQNLINKVNKQREKRHS